MEIREMDASIFSKEELKNFVGDGKFLEGDAGWLFLTNDGNDQLAQQFGFQRWNDEDEDQANHTIESRKAAIPTYKKFIIPEKSVAYREYLPKFLRNQNDYQGRPCLRLKDSVYLLNCILQGKPLGNLYFRGDTHPNWFGSYFLYAQICRALHIKPLRLNDFNQRLSGFDGDLIAHMNAEERQEYLERVDHFPFTLDATVELRVNAPKSVHVGDGGYTEFSRETLVYQQDDSSLPRAVVFRDSTCQFMTSWFAEHFSRSVFIWHRGDVIADVIEREQPDIVFQIMAERFVWTYPARLPVV